MVQSVLDGILHQELDQLDELAPRELTGTHLDEVNGINPFLSSLQLDVAESLVAVMSHVLTMDFVTMAFLVCMTVLGSGNRGMARYAYRATVLKSCQLP